MNKLKNNVFVYMGLMLAIIASMLFGIVDAKEILEKFKDKYKLVILSKELYNDWR